MISSFRSAQTGCAENQLGL